MGPDTEALQTDWRGAKLPDKPMQRTLDRLRELAKPDEFGDIDIWPGADDFDHGIPDDISVNTGKLYTDTESLQRTVDRLREFTARPDEHGDTDIWPLDELVADAQEHGLYPDDEDLRYTGPGSSTNTNELPTNAESVVMTDRRAGYEEARRKFSKWGYDRGIAHGRSAALVESREKLALFMLNAGFSTGHGDTIDDLIIELAHQLDVIDAVEGKTNGT